MGKEGFLAGVAVLPEAGIVMIVAWQTLPLLWNSVLGRGDEPRLMQTRGDLADDGLATIALFEAAQNRVVFILTQARVHDPWRWKAYIAIPHDRLEPLPIEASRSLHVGQKVFAIGNRFGIDLTLMKGVASVLEREIPTERGLAIRSLIETDTAINPGNSEGPLLDSAGQLIGANTSIFSPSGTGSCYVVPGDTVNHIAPCPIATARYSSPQIGVLIGPRVEATVRRVRLVGSAGRRWQSLAWGSHHSDRQTDRNRCRRSARSTRGMTMVDHRFDTARPEKESPFRRPDLARWSRR